ncbi:glycosyltransferase family 4 protein [Candidatus Roizmanbacteria bacterium]|nr:glycosyltransferase family 4 protein [Candidatus Roizmanbacteria bacterium]
MNTKNKPGFLIVSAIPPFPVDSGGAVRIRNTIQYLSYFFDLYVICFLPIEYKPADDEEKWLKKYTKQYWFIPQQSNKSNHFFYIDNQPYWFSTWSNNELKLLISHVITSYAIKAVEIDFTQLLYLEKYIQSNVRKIYIAHDVSTITFWRRLREVTLMRRFIHFFRWIQVFYYENKYIKKYDIVVAMSKKDGEYLKKLFNPSHTYIAPNGVDFQEWHEKKSNGTLRIGYIGSCAHPPNKYAIHFLIHHIKPLLEKKRLDFKIVIAGANNEKVIDTLIKNDRNTVINMGKIKKVAYFYDNIDLLVAPIFSGSGTRIKILEALGHHVPVITTSIGAEGLEELHSPLLQLANSPEDFVNKIVISANKRIDVKNMRIPAKYQWKEIFKSYAQNLVKLMR